MIITSAVSLPCLHARHGVVESGPAEISSECRRHERGRAQEGGFPPSRKGVGGFAGFPQRKFLNYVRFNAFWKLLQGARISVILAKNLASLT